MAIFLVCVARIFSEIGVNVVHLLLDRFGRKKIFGVHPKDFYGPIPYVTHGHFLGLCCSDFSKIGVNVVHLLIYGFC